MRSLLYSGDLLAVDLGTFAVKVLSLKAKERSLTVLASAQREVWRELADAKTEEEKTEIYARALRELLAAHGFKLRNASISLSGNVIIVRFLSVPAGASEAGTGLSAEARALIPFAEADAIVTALTLRGASDKKAAGEPSEMMLIAAQKKTVQGGMSVVRRAGLRPTVIINDVLALANAYEFFKSRKEAETVVLVNAGASSTSVSVAEGGFVKTARVFNIAGNTFTRAVKREFGVELEEAESLKISYGIAGAGAMSEEQKAVADRVAAALKPAVKDLSVEIQRTIDAFLERRPADYPAISRILLAGGSAELKGLPELLTAGAGVPVEVFRPMVNVSAKDGSLGIAPLAAVLAVPCGLGLSNALLRRSLKPRINLVPRRARRAAIIRDVSPGFWRAIAVPAVVVFALCAYGVWAVRLSRRESAAEQRLEDASKAVRELELKLKKKPQAAVKSVEAHPFAFLGRLVVSGVFGDKQNSLVMLSGGAGVFVARGGKLFNADEVEVRGVTSEIRDKAVVLTAGGKRYSIDLPK